ncbi:unnamed protein product [Rhizoctonia solani]|uniref:Uncharacterized protein n=1 Tax=Rhizoctonia solani TaxID=456999 RepID=A0A8H3GP27_9AGAM|nr:unnamed protein product [Rhizoctonia solani]
MASSSSSSKPKKRLRNMRKETLRVHSRSKSPSQSSNLPQQPDPSLGPPASVSSSPQVKPSSPETGDPSKAPDNVARSENSRFLQSTVGTEKMDLSQAVPPLNPTWTTLRASIHSLRDSAQEFSPIAPAVDTLLSCLDALEITAKDWLDYEEEATNLTLVVDSLQQIV